VHPSSVFSPLSSQLMFDPSSERVLLTLRAVYFSFVRRMVRTNIRFVVDQPCVCGRCTASCCTASIPRRFACGKPFVALLVRTALRHNLTSALHHAIRNGRGNGFVTRTAHQLLKWSATHQERKEGKRERGGALNAKSTMENKERRKMSSPLGDRAATVGTSSPQPVRPAPSVLRLPLLPPLFPVRPSSSSLLCLPPPSVLLSGEVA
jgi:hypothetical protein